MPRLPLILLLLLAPLAAEELTIATYNIYFLDDNITAERRERLRTVLAELDADVVAFQEIDNAASIPPLLSDDYRVAMIDDPEVFQELALAVRAPLQIKSTRMVFPDPLHDDPFPAKRDLLEVVVEGYGREFVFLVHHAKSRVGGRWKNDVRRERAAQMIVEYVRNELTGKPVVVLGDFNDNPDDRSLNILESGDPQAPAGIDAAPDRFLFNTTETLVERDICSYGYYYLYRDELPEGERFDPVVPGSRAENNRWRGKEYDYRRDVKIKETLLDQILVSMNLKPLVTGSGIFNHRAAIEGTRTRVRFTDHGLQYQERGSFASDHVPVWVRLQLPAGD